MIRFLFLVLLVFALPVFAAGHTVTAVLPVKFNSIGPYPAPVPYSQKMMNGGRMYVPTLTNAQKSEIFMRDLNRKSGFQPQVVTKDSLSKTVSKMGRNSSKLHPALRAAFFAATAYEANCVTQAFPSFCMSTGGPTSEAEVDINTPHVNAKMQDVVSCNAYYNGEHLGTFSGNTFGECLNAGATAVSSKIVLPKATETSVLSPSITLEISRSFDAIPCPSNATSCSVGSKVTQTSTQKTCVGNTSGGVTCTTSTPTTFVQYISGSVSQASKSTLPKCPPDGKEAFKFGPFKPAGATNFRCYMGTTEAPATPEEIQAAFEANPQLLNAILGSPDIGLNDFVDWETGQPYDSLFPEKRFDDVSEKFANAAQSIASGTAQTSDPSNTQTYIPPDIYNVTVTNVNQWFEGSTFTDTFTQQNITPDDGQTPEGIPTDWTDFPGITQKQYETSNERWATGAMSELGSIDNAKADEDTAFDQFSDFVSAPVADPKFFTLADYVSLPTSGSCMGFTIDAPLSAQSMSIHVNQHCPPYDAWGRPLVEWFLGILTIIQLFRIFQRTLEVA